MRPALVCLCLVACDPVPATAPPASVARVATWADDAALSLDPTHPRLTLRFIAEECPRHEVRVFGRAVKSALDSEGVTFALSFAEVPLERCVQKQEVMLSATVECGDDDVRALAARTVSVDDGLSPIGGYVPIAQRYRTRASTEPKTGISWRQRGDRIEGGGVTLSHVTPNVRQLTTDGATHAFFTSSCIVFCPPMRVLVDNVDTPVNSELVLAVPHTATGEIDARSDAFRIAAAGHLIDVGFLDGMIYTLGEENGRVFVSRHAEAALAMTDKTIVSTATALPFRRAHGFYQTPDGDLVALGSRDDGSVGQWSMRGMGIPDVNTTCAPSTPVPVPYPWVGGGGSAGDPSAPPPSGTMTEGVVSSTNMGPAGWMTGAPTVVVEGCVRPAGLFTNLDVLSGGDDAMATTSLTLAFNGLFRSGPDRLALVYASPSGENAVRLQNVANDTATWLTVNGRALVDEVRGVTFASDRILVTTARGWQLFSLDGAWLAGVARLPAGCAPGPSNVEGGGFSIELANGGAKIE